MYSTAKSPSRLGTERPLLGELPLETKKNDSKVARLVKLPANPSMGLAGLSFGLFLLWSPKYCVRCPRNFLLIFDPPVQRR